MTWRLRDICNLMLVLVIVATSGSMAAARGQAQDAAGSIVLCTGSGPVSVPVDSDGRPVGPVHFCPDCALSMFDAALQTPVIPPRAERVRRLLPMPCRTHVSLFDRTLARARSPPLS